MAEEPLIYRIVTTRKPYETRVVAQPNIWASGIEGQIRWPGLLTMQLSVDIRWSCGGMSYGPEDARKFFRAGMKVAAAIERELKRGPKKEARRG